MSRIQSWFRGIIVARGGALSLHDRDYGRHLQRFLSTPHACMDVLPDGRVVRDLDWMIASVTFEMFLRGLQQRARLRRGKETIYYWSETSQEFTGVVMFRANVEERRCICRAKAHPLPGWLRNATSRALFAILEQTGLPRSFDAYEQATALASIQRTNKRGGRQIGRLAHIWRDLPEILFLVGHRLCGWRRVPP